MQYVIDRIEILHTARTVGQSHGWRSFDFPVTIDGHFTEDHNGKPRRTDFRAQLESVATLPILSEFYCGIEQRARPAYDALCVLITRALEKPIAPRETR